jgi:hypothetical protein
VFVVVAVPQGVAGEPNHSSTPETLSVVARSASVATAVTVLVSAS